MIRDLTDRLTELFEFLRTRGRHQWVWRLVMLAAGAGAELWTSRLVPAPLLAFLAWVLLVLAVLVPRTQVLTCFAALELLRVGLLVRDPLQAVPLAILLLLAHAAAAALAVGRPWARVDRRSWRGLLVPTVAGLGALAIAVALVLVVPTLAVPHGLVIGAVLALLVVAAGIATVWSPRRTS